MENSENDGDCGDIDDGNDDDYNFENSVKRWASPLPHIQPTLWWYLYHSDNAGLQQDKGVWELQNDMVPKEATAYIFKIGGGIHRESLNI